MYMEAGHDNTTWQQRKLNHSIDFSRGTTWRGYDLDGRSLANERRGPWSRFSPVSLSECLIQRQCMGTLLLPFAYVVLQIGRLWTMTNVVLLLFGPHQEIDRTAVWWKDWLYRFGNTTTVHAKDNTRTVHSCARDSKVELASWFAKLLVSRSNSHWNSFG